ncbi:MAG: 1-acyl-sn-glycerol-3-phosphate acyltransferase [Noviherbaspirillum sp.]|nr:1-acyl-sn-glycerol-3-phosphate acyltransferase [Noviherbaspirillum sp.]
MSPAYFFGKALIGLVRLLVGATPHWTAAAPSNLQRIYFANHTSHIDTIAIWSALPPELRAQTRPVAARDYWGASGLRRYIALRVLNAVLIDRDRKNQNADPLAPLFDALRGGDSLIIFPEGTRGADSLPGPFKSGLYRLTEHFPEVELVPVYLENLHRSMPKGVMLPVPLTCTVRFAGTLRRIDGEEKSDFLERARRAIVEIA